MVWLYVPLLTILNEKKKNGEKIIVRMLPGNNFSSHLVNPDNRKFGQRGKVSVYLNTPIHDE